ncbi:hypothetical protein LAWI1_G005000 [Lachnellula willkommii]|uniref:Uncharacterized protein n=1 Tax=Lachnellula willkommii TaxID=215461 RepID=A0A559M545_9HELO|nr:hypothetical protein LAWI1_G005000 [Lachnellula willkommii]
MYLTLPPPMVLAIFTLFQTHAAFALPTTSLTTRVTSSLHACSVFVQRWDSNAFDVAYYSAAPTSNWTWDYPYQTNFWNQESSDDESSAQGSQLVPYQVGSNVLYITNTANPVTNDTAGGHDDPGELSFAWGSDTFNSFNSSSCLVAAVGEDWKTGGATRYQCTFQCDVDVAS